MKFTPPILTDEELLEAWREGVYTPKLSVQIATARAQAEKDAAIISELVEALQKYIDDCEFDGNDYNFLTYENARNLIKRLTNA